MSWHLVTDLTDVGLAQSALAQLRDRVEDLTPLMDEIGSGLVTSTGRRFEDQAGPDGQPWPSLAESTILQRLGGKGRAFTKKGEHTARSKRLLGGMKILQDQRRLEQSITHEPGRDQVEVGSNLVYAAIHQFGGEAGRGKAATIPARPYLGIDSEDEREIDGAIQAWLRSALP